MKNILKFIVFGSISLFLMSCGAYFNQPVGVQEARISEQTKITERLKNIPPPATKIEVGVYNFKDQTGQYKNIQNVSTFSTAVTQGATTILVKALEDSKWFTPIERENLSNLLNERNIIRTTRDEYRTSANEPPKKISPLLFAGILLEGGIISYDSNILTGGAGARYFGVGASTKYRQDRITVYLRAVSTSTGEVLKTVNASKTILSQAVDVGIFRYVNFQRLLEVETGFTKNEPSQMAVQEAIEKAVELLILEGIKDQLWSTKEGAEKNKEIVDAYVLEQEAERSTSLYERRYLKNDFRNIINVNAGTALIDGDYNSNVLDFKVGFGYKYRIIPELSIGTDFQLFKLNPTSTLNNWWLSESINLEYIMLPNDRLSPFFYSGAGILFYADNNPEMNLEKWDSFFNFKVGAGLQYTVSDRVSFAANAEWNMPFTDKLDGIIQGRRDDFYYTFSLGFNYHFGFESTNFKAKK